MPVEDSRPRTGLWYLGGFVASVAVGWLAAMLQVAGFAPIGILSIGVGVLLGTMLTGLAIVTRVKCRRSLMVGCVVMAVVAVLAEHAWLYREFRRQWHESRANSSEAALFRPESPMPPSEYFARELSVGRAGLWLFDAMLIVVAAVAAVIVLGRRWPVEKQF